MTVTFKGVDFAIFTDLFYTNHGTSTAVWVCTGNHTLTLDMPVTYILTG
jgi:hypothetical protein